MLATPVLGSASIARFVQGVSHTVIGKTDSPVDNFRVLAPCMLCSHEAHANIIPTATARTMDACLPVRMVRMIQPPPTRCWKLAADAAKIDGSAGRSKR